MEDDIKKNSPNNNVLCNRAALEQNVERGLLGNGVDDECDTRQHSNGVVVYSADDNSEEKPRDSWRCFKNRPYLMGTLVSSVTLAAILIAFFLGKWSKADAVSCQRALDSRVGNESYLASNSVDYPAPTITEQFPVTYGNVGTPIVRLPRDVSPVHYDLLFNLRNLHERRFAGTVSILVRCDNDTDTILLHVGNEITLDNVELQESDGRKNEIKILKWSRKTKPPLLTIRTINGMKQNSFYVLKIDFSTVVCGERSGFVCGNNENVDGPEKVFIATKFEPNFARTAFPCFDEPHLKATFNLSVVRTREMTVLTNTPSLK